MDSKIPVEMHSVLVDEYNKGKSLRKVSYKYGLNPVEVRAVLEMRGLVIRKKGTQAEYLPTPKEIEEQTKRIREGWTEEQWRRQGGYNQPPVQFPFYSVRFQNSSLVLSPSSL